MFTLVPLDRFLGGFSKFLLFMVSWVLHKNYSMRWLSIHGNHCTLSLRRTNFRVCSANAKTISSLAELTRKCLKVEHLGRIEYEFQNLVLQAIETMRIRFLQKVFFFNFTLVYGTFKYIYALLIFACGLLLCVCENIVDICFCIVVLCPAVPRIDIHGWMDAV
jgi:hypothetical protein